jgi:hypothetical protein
MVGSQLVCTLTQFEHNEVVHRARTAAVCFWHDGLGYRAVLFNKVDEHIPLPAVWQRIGKEPHNDTTVEGFKARRNNVFEEVIGFLKFVPEHEIGLGEFELFDVHLFPGQQSQRVEPGKHPASAGAFLIGGFGRFDEVRKSMCRPVDHFAVEGHGTDIGLGDGVECQTILRIGIEVFDKCCPIIPG